MIHIALKTVVTQLKSTVNKLHVSVTVCERNQRTTDKIIKIKDVITVMKTKVERVKSIFMSGRVNKLELEDLTKKGIP